MNQKSIIAILGVVIIILIGTTVYFVMTKNVNQPTTTTSNEVQQPVPTPATQQPSQPVTEQKPTAQPTVESKNWQTYQNEIYGYEIEYPSYWIKNNFPAGDTRSALEYKSANILLDQGGHGTPFDWKIEKSTVTSGGRQLEVATFTKDQNIVSKIVSIPTQTKNQEGQKMTISIELTGSINDGIIKDFDKIISTLKFTN
jgi:hypothetical protein